MKKFRRLTATILTMALVVGMVMSWGTPVEASWPFWHCYTSWRCIPWEEFCTHYDEPCECPFPPGRIFCSWRDEAINRRIQAINERVQTQMAID